MERKTPERIYLVINECCQVATFNKRIFRYEAVQKEKNTAF